MLVSIVLVFIFYLVCKVVSYYTNGLFDLQIGFLMGATYAVVIKILERVGF